MEKVKVTKGQKLVVVLSNGEEIVFEGQEDGLARPLKNGWREKLLPGGEYAVYNPAFAAASIQEAFYTDTNQGRKYPGIVQERKGIFCPGPQGQRVVGVIAPFSDLRGSFSNLHLFGWGTEEKKTRRKGGKPHIENGVLYWGEERLGAVLFYVAPDKNRLDGIAAVLAPPEEEMISLTPELKELMKDLGGEIIELEDMVRSIAQGVMGALASTNWFIK